MDERDLHIKLREHHDHSFVWALRCSGQKHSLAEDALQNVYLKILEGKASFDGRSAFKTWLFSVIRFTVLDLLRSDQKRLIRRKDYQDQPSASPEDEIGEVGPDIKQKIAELPPRQQQVLDLVFYHNMTLEEIASVLQISIGSVRQHYDRGKKKMRLLLTQKPTS